MVHLVQSCSFSGPSSVVLFGADIEALTELSLLILLLASEVGIALGYLVHVLSLLIFAWLQTPYGERSFLLE